MINEVEGFTLKPFMDFGVGDTKSLVYTDERNRRQARIASCTMFMLYVYDCIKADRWLQPEPQLIGFEVVGESGLKGNNCLRLGWDGSCGPLQLPLRGTSGHVCV